MSARDAPIVALAVLSIGLTVLTYVRAYRLHRAIEAIQPGFNARMRTLCRVWRRIRFSRHERG